MKKIIITFLTIAIIFIGAIASYKVVAGNKIEDKTYAFLETKGYIKDDILDLDIKHSFINKLLSFNEWRIFVTFKNEPDITLAFAYRNNEIIRQGISSTSPLDKDEILYYGQKFDDGTLNSKATAEQVITSDQNDESDELITYNGKEYKKSELCNATLHWLELSEQERMFSSYLPPELMTFEETWGITLTTDNITPSSITIKCTQSGGDAIGELQTGSWYILENWTQESGWKEMPYAIQSEFAWTSEAWIIPMNDTVEWEVNWEWLYGKVPDGKYRIGKEIMDFKGPGDYDKAIYFVEFEIP